MFANRYDGIDLAGDSCRILIMVGLPIGASEYDIYRSAIFSGVTILNYELAQRIEQGMGRGARGPNDYCVVIATGRNLVQFLSIIDNQRLLTSSTHAQIHMGLEVSNDVKNEEELKTTILTCLDRNREWQEYHADRLATLATSREMDQEQIRLANVEVKAFKQLRTHLFEEAIAGLNQFLDKTSNIDQKYRGWLKQFAARIAYYGGLQDLAQQYQVQAYLDNNNLLRPKSTLPYATIHNGSHQAKEIVEKIVSYQPYRGFLTRFEEIISMLTATSSSNQFEQSLKELGEMLGFQSQRPEKQFGVGPDVLWMLNNNTGIVMEVKSRKDPKNPLDKKEHGQLLNAEAWFKKEYPNCKCLRVSVHPNNIATKNTPADFTKVLTLQKVDDLVVSGQALFAELCAVELPLENLIAKCDQLLLKFGLNSDSFIIKYLSSFIIE